MYLGVADRTSLSDEDASVLKSVNIVVASPEPDGALHRAQSSDAVVFDSRLGDVWLMAKRRKAWAKRAGSQQPNSNLRVPQLPGGHSHSKPTAPLPCPVLACLPNIERSGPV